MATFNTFTCFQHLPTELRFKIWKDALGDPGTDDGTAWVIGRHYRRNRWRANGESDPNEQPENAPFRMTCTIPFPQENQAHVARTCREAHQIVEETFGPAFRVPTPELQAAKRVWLDLDRTFFVFAGYAPDISPALDAISEYDRSRIQHIGVSLHAQTVVQQGQNNVTWDFEGSWRADLCKSCPSLRTVVVRFLDDDEQQLKGWCLTGKATAQYLWLLRTVHAPTIHVHVPVEKRRGTASPRDAEDDLTSLVDYIAAAWALIPPRRRAVAMDRYRQSSEARPVLFIGFRPFEAP